MAWVHDTGYEPAYAHTGMTAPVLDPPPAPGQSPTEAARARASDIIGWRTTCTCGWAGTTYPSPAHDAETLDDLGGPAEREWSAHLHHVLPGLAAHDAQQGL